MSARPSVIAEQELHSGFARLVRLELDLGDGRRAFREVEDHGDAAAVLPYDPERKVACLVELPRAPLLYRKRSPHHREAPAGLIDDGESPEAAARREALEEVGIALSKLDFVTRAYSMPGLSTEAMHLYLAAYSASDRVGEGGGIASEDEDIVVREVPLADLWTALESGELTDMKTIVLLHALRHRQPGLFA